MTKNESTFLYPQFKNGIYTPIVIDNICPVYNSIRMTNSGGRNKTRKMREEKTISSQVANHIAVEKRKARSLRNTSWWRRKIATGICHYCGRKFKPQELTMDHKIPLSRGGTSERFNIVPACKECNTKKKYLLPPEWDEYIQRLAKTQ
jgi:5-methylcytosine-specific restriction protein A